MVLDILELKKKIDEMGLKQKFVSEKTGIPEPKLCMILNGKRKCEVGEYASICAVIGSDIREFIKEKEG